MDNLIQYEHKYEDNKFWRKLIKIAKTSSVQLIEKALVLYYSAKDENTPKWAKSVIFGALGYLVFPLDAIPDFIPVAGYTDDITVLISAISTVVLYITDEHKEKARQKVEKIL